MASEGPRAWASAGAYLSCGVGAQVDFLSCLCFSLPDSRFPWPLRLLPATGRVCKGPRGSPTGTLPPFQPLQRRTRRHRTIFSEEQLQALEALFLQNQYPDVVAREHLANRIHLKEERVEVGSSWKERPGPENFSGFRKTHRPSFLPPGMPLPASAASHSSRLPRFLIPISLPFLPSLFHLPPSIPIPFIPLISKTLPPWAICVLRDLPALVFCVLRSLPGMTFS